MRLQVRVFQLVLDKPLEFVEGLAAAIFHTFTLSLLFLNFLAVHLVVLMFLIHHIVIVVLMRGIPLTKPLAVEGVGQAFRKVQMSALKWATPARLSAI